MHLIRPNTSSQSDLRSCWLDTSELLNEPNQKVQLAMVNDKIVVLATNAKDRSLTVSGIESLSIEQLIGQSLKQGKLQTALNIVMETG